MHAQLKKYQQRVNSALQTYLSDQVLLNPNIPKTLTLALTYATLNQGKRLRPALIYGIGEAFGIPLTQLDSVACAMELIHSYSLVHDDLPAMDDDDLRRGQPTCHIKFNEATAILAGDAQQTLAFQLISEDPYISNQAKVLLIQILSKASGLHGMIGGQMIDIESEGQQPKLGQLKTMHLMKTGALIQASLLMGACQSPLYPESKPNIERFGQCIGLAFQVQDDILDIESSTAVLGKPQGSDIEANKSTYPKILGLEKSKHYRDELISDALNTLDSFTLKSKFLEDLTRYIAQRSH